MLGEIEGLHLESEEKRQSFLLKKKKNAYKEKSKCSGTVGSGKKKKDSPMDAMHFSFSPMNNHFLFTTSSK